MADPPSFFDLPGELRNEIYKHALHCDAPIMIAPVTKRSKNPPTFWRVPILGIAAHFSTALLRTHPRITREASGFFFNDNIFRFSSDLTFDVNGHLFESDSSLRWFLERIKHVELSSWCDTLHASHGPRHGPARTNRLLAGRLDGWLDTLRYVTQLDLPTTIRIDFAGRDGTRPLCKLRPLEPCRAEFIDRWLMGDEKRKIELLLPLLDHQDAVRVAEVIVDTTERLMCDSPDESHDPREWALYEREFDHGRYPQFKYCRTESLAGTECEDLHVITCDVQRCSSGRTLNPGRETHALSVVMSKQLLSGQEGAVAQLETYKSQLSQDAIVSFAEMLKRACEEPPRQGNGDAVFEQGICWLCRSWP